MGGELRPAEQRGSGGLHIWRRRLYQSLRRTSSWWCYRGIFYRQLRKHPPASRACLLQPGLSAEARVAAWRVPYRRAGSEMILQEKGTKEGNSNGHSKTGTRSGCRKAHDALPADTGQRHLGLHAQKHKAPGRPADGRYHWTDLRRSGHYAEWFFCGARLQLCQHRKRREASVIFIRVSDVQQENRKRARSAVWVIWPVFYATWIFILMKNQLSSPLCPRHQKMPF